MNERHSRTYRPKLNSRQIDYIKLQLTRKIGYFKREAIDEKYRETMENNTKAVQKIIQSLDETMATN